MGTAGIKLAVRGTLVSGDEWREMFYYTGEGDYTDVGVQTWVAEVYDTVKASMVPGTTIYGVDVAPRLTTYDDTDPRGWGASDFVAVTWAGSDAGEALPPGDCYLVLALTGVKHVMGRKFIPGIAENCQANGVLQGAQVTALTNFGAKLYNPTAKPLSGTPTACVWGTRHGFTPIIGARASSKVFHLRKRQQGRGI